MSKHETVDALDTLLNDVTDAAARFKHADAQNYTLDMKFYGGVLADLAPVLAERMKAMAWRRCDSEKPDAETTVLLFHPNGNVALGYTDGDEWYTEGGESCTPSNWMNIPLIF